MCGIAGSWTFSRKQSSQEMQDLANQMGDCLIHRGPDEGGVWVDPREGIALAHRRLSILDLSPAGHQPMTSRSGQYVLILNGEIYNFIELRQELESLGHVFRGRSDTEVLLAAIDEWGIDGAITRSNGMFAFAVWDCKRRQLRLVRDRIGEKPLYYAWTGDAFLFGSELKALRCHPNFRAEIDRGSLALYLRHNYIPAPYSIYKGVHKLPPGSTLCISDPGSGPHPSASYWSARKVAEQGVAVPFSGSAEEAIAQLEMLLRASVRSQMVADVPLGAFLSGGIDSSIVVALMQAQSDRPVKTFTIGFHEPGYDEAGYAGAVAKSLGTDHTELYVTAQETMAVVPQLPTIYDEPFSDSSQIPTFLVSKLARRFVTVSLSGDGGDELFAGYRRYAVARQLWSGVGWLPSGGRQVLSSILASRSLKRLSSVIGSERVFFGQSGRPGPLADKFQKLAEVIPVQDREQFYLRLMSNWQFPASLLPEVEEPSTVFTDRGQWAALSNFVLWMMFVDTASYLPDDILVKLDRASMNVGLESRVPFLDRHVVEFAARLPLSMRFREGKGKWITRQILRKYIPKELVERPKQGFAIPLGLWLRGPLRDWAEALLDEARLRADGIFSPAPIRKKWAEHVSGRRNWEGPLWNVLVFQAWLEQTKTETSRPTEPGKVQMFTNRYA